MELLELHGITKRFGNNVANSDIDLTIKEGEVHVLFGENGAGKTTLMNILYGLYEKDEGQIFLNGKEVNIKNPSESIALGIGMVHQHFMLVSKMTLVQNIMLGLHPDGYPVFRKKELRAEIAALSEKYGLQLDLDKPVSKLSVGMQQRGEIMKALYRKAKIIILDEPTAVLTPQEIDDLFDIIRTLKKEGHSIILISHKLQEIMAISDRVTVLRDGKVVKTLLTKETNSVELSNYMIGREIKDVPYERKSYQNAEPVLEMENVSLKGAANSLALDHMSFAVHAGEILGVAGVDGNGQKELAEVITGIRKASSGNISLNAKNITKDNIRKHFEAGISYVSDDRHKDSMIMDESVQNNLMLRTYYQQPFSKNGVFRHSTIHSHAEELVAEYNIKTDGTGQKSRLLSGGNQQKMVLARELASNPSLVVACQPTRGLDIGATDQMRSYLVECRNKGNGVLLISTDLEEILRMSDRILVINGGKKMGLLENKNVDINLIGRMMAGEQEGNE